jgi:intracellular sulfur oxidation DsrE/DsrF family protein
MGTASAIPPELQKLSAALYGWNEAIDVHRARLGTFPKTSVHAQTVRPLAARVQTMALGVGDTANNFLAADSASVAASKPVSAAKTSTQKMKMPRQKVLPQGWQEALARQQVASANAKAVKALEKGLSKTKKRTEQLTALLNDPTATYLRADGTGDGRVVQVFGDLVSAQHIIVFVPGMDNELNDYRESLQKRAQSVLAEMQRQAGPGVPVAVVAWLGYDTPDYTPVRLVTQAATSNKAVDGAKALESDLVNIRKQNPRAHITVLAHSYGTVVLGEAMRRGLNVSDAIAVGSPGMNTTSRKKLLSPGVKFWASKSTKSAWSIASKPIVTVPFDPISVLPTHGEDPSAKGFGANRFSSGDSLGHSDYFRAGTAALRNIVAIGLGRPPTFTPEPKKKPLKPARRAKISLKRVPQRVGFLT